jgi:hypothetical protein
MEQARSYDAGLTTDGKSLAPSFVKIGQMFHKLKKGTYSEHGELASLHLSSRMECKY